MLAKLLVSSSVLAACCGWFLSPENAARSGTVSRPQDRKLHRDPAFGGYWHRGKAEVTRFALEQSRYGQTHAGDAVLVFVTEDFLAKDQVKFEGHTHSPQDVVPVLKLNHFRKFATGIYDYSMMASVFTPERLSEGVRTIKVSASVQEWCGQAWVQLNLRADETYGVTGHSYFQREGDQEFQVPGAMPEDAIFTTVRIDPKRLPIGKTRIIPSLFDTRLRHYELTAYDAECALEDLADGKRRYRVSYPKLRRTLRVTFEKSFPHRIQGFEEEFSRAGERQVTKATATHTKLIDYWNMKKRSFAAQRAELGLK